MAVDPVHVPWELQILLGWDTGSHMAIRVIPTKLSPRVVREGTRVSSLLHYTAYLT